jgi:hypothetical protein
MTREQKQKAIEVIKNADFIGRYAMFRQVAYGKAIAPVCSLGHLGYAANPGSMDYMLGWEIVQREYGLTDRQMSRIADLNDTTPDDKRKERILSFLRNVHIEGRKKK